MGLATRMATSRPPQQSRRLLVSMLLAIMLASHVPAAAAAGIGLAVLTAVLCCLWLQPRWAIAALAVIPAVGVPLPFSATGVVMTGLGSLLLVTAGLTITRLTQRMRDAQGSARRHMDAHDELERRAAQERAMLSRQLARASTRDPLTGVLNRSALIDELDAMLAADTPVGVLVLSLARFGEVNDRYGAVVGDEVLTSVAERLSASARGEDLVGRLGGDEFAMLLDGLLAEDAQQVCDRLKALLDAPFVIGPNVVELTVRSGLALPDRDEATGAAGLLHRAASAAAGSAVGEGTTVYDPLAEAAAAAQRELEADMRVGLERGDFFLLYQPKVCTRSGRLVSVEALVRWHHPVRGVMAPDFFIGLAERTGLIVPLGLHVLALACAQLKAWTDVSPDLTIAVNVSARQLEPRFVDEVEQIVVAAGVEPQRLILEVTESLLMTDEAESAGVLWRLRGLGLRLSLDDFGTGYSSLARLGSLPLDELKIDKSFVDRLGAAANDTVVLVTAAVAMAHGLGLRVVAEGVEDEQQAAVLTGLDCDVLQGYLLGRPQSAERVGEQLDSVGLRA